MKNNVIILLDYKGHFTSKWASKPYRSGMDLKLIKNEFNNYGFNVEFKYYPEINFRENYKDDFILYTSSEDDNVFYKSYVEDIIYALELKGVKLIPSYKLLKAHHNKVFMEMLRDISYNKDIKKIKSNYFGTKEEFLQFQNTIKYPAVIKSAAGASSLGVKKLESSESSKKIVDKISRSKNLLYEFKDYLRSLRHKGYKKESKNRNKFIVQNLLPGLTKDWKILIFWDKYFILERSAKENDFRASGSGIIKYPEIIPEGIFDFAKKIFEEFDQPYFALDIGFDGQDFVLIEFQALNFGTHTLDTAPFYYKKENNAWKKYNETAIVEKELVASVVNYVNAKG